MQDDLSVRDDATRASLLEESAIARARPPASPTPKKQIAQRLGELRERGSAEREHRERLTKLDR
jgi:hypothetical protein